MRSSIGAILIVTVPDTTIRSECLGDAHGTMPSRSTSNREKRIAIAFYNYPAGKANIGASYLNVAESIARVLQRLKQEGYDVGTSGLSGNGVLQTLLAKSRNVAGYAPGELQALLDQGGAIRVSIADYNRWLNALSPPLKAKVLKDWGTPDKSKPMTPKQLRNWRCGSSDCPDRAWRSARSLTSSLTR